MTVEHCQSLSNLINTLLRISITTAGPALVANLLKTQRINRQTEQPAPERMEQSRQITIGKILLG